MLSPRTVTSVFLLLALGCAVAAGPSFGARLEDALDPDWLARHLRVEAGRKEALASRIEELRRAVASYQWERGRQTAEAALWNGQAPDIQKLRQLRVDARKQVDAILDSLSAALDPKQAERLKKLFKGEENLLDLSAASLPFYHVNNTPLFPRFQSSAEAYGIALPATPSADSSWTYADLMRTWTVRSYIPYQPPVEEVNDDRTGIVQNPDLQTRILSDPYQRRVVRSPLLLAATLLIPDLARREFDLLWEHYPRQGEDREAAWDRYCQQNRLDDAVLIRLKMSTPYAREYLDLDRWTIFIEDGEGVGYEPVQIQTESLRPIESLEISVPGQEIEVTDVFGNYYPYIPGNKETFFLEAPAKVTYAGYEKLVRLFFPAYDFQRRPVIGNRMQTFKLVVQSRENEYARTELLWDLKRPKPDRPPASKDKG